jgi:hypothetical protein
MLNINPLCKWVWECTIPICVIALDGQFWQELKRRKVVRVISVYTAATFAILEFVSINAEPFGLPDSTL